MYYRRRSDKREENIMTANVLKTYHPEHRGVRGRPRAEEGTEEAADESNDDDDDDDYGDDDEVEDGAKKYDGNS